MLKAFKYRIYPTEDQRHQIDASIGVCRLVYNLALDIKIRAWKEQQKNVTAFDLCYQLVDLRNEYDWIKIVSAQALQASVKSVDVAFKNFYSGKGYPKFKRKKTGGSFRCPSNLRRIDWDKSTLDIPKIKDIPIVLSRRFEGEIKTITITKTSTEKYFASILVETSQKEPIPPAAAKAIGIDLGIKDFATLSTGEKIANPRHLQKSLSRLNILQRRMSKKQKGSSNRKKASLKVALAYEKISNQRNDFLHKLSTRLISESQTDTICVETLPVRNLIQNRRMSQAISDVGWGEFVRQLEYKARWYGKNLIKIGRFEASSKTCSNCGAKNDALELQHRYWTCESCHTAHDRDINAAINIRNIGLNNSGRGTPVEPAEQRAIVRAMKQEKITDSNTPDNQFLNPNIKDDE